MSSQGGSSGFIDPAIGLDHSPDTDHRVRVRAFRRNIRRCKLALGCTLSAALATGGAHLALLPYRDNGGSDQAWIGPARWWSNFTIMCLTVFSTIMLLLTLWHRPFPARLRPADLGGLAHMGLHRAACVGVFLASLFSIILHVAPGVVYTIITKRAPPAEAAAVVRMGEAHIVALVACLMAAGCMRRGPHLRASEVTLGTAFGIRPINDHAKSKYWYEGDNGQDVIDYGNCSMLTFLTLGYSISLADRWRKDSQLAQGDLPMLEEWVRTSGNEFLHDLAPEGGQFQPFSSMGLVKTLWSGRGWAIFITFALETLNTAISFVQVTAVHELIATFGKSDDYSYQYLMCWGVFLGQAVGVLLSAYLWVRENYILHNPVRLTLSAILYAKILRSTDAKAMEAQHLTSEDDEKANKGRAQVMNLLTIDTSTIASMATYLWSITNGMVRLTIGLIFLYKMLGLASFVAVLCIPLLTPLSVWVAKKSYECDKAWARARDARTGAIKEFLMGIKVIKLNAFETYEIRRVGQLRDVETRWQRWRYTLGTAFNIIADQMPNIAMLLTFVTYTKVMGKPLEPATAFVAITVFDSVRSGLNALPGAVDIVLSTKISLDRLKGYLNQAEVERDPHNVSECRIIMDDATFSWPRGEVVTDPIANQTPSFQMRHFNLVLPDGRITLICGPLGAGKTLFLRALLGEAHVDSGRIIAPRSAPDLTPLDTSLIKIRWSDDIWLEGSVAYAPQMSYIRHGTIRDNIIFGQPFWQERYDEVLRQCSLWPDMTLLVDGDLTEVGENGVNLSGGQKARINLARCLYSRARTIYLDDVLSAVDAHTAQYIVDECFRGELVRGRTVILVSHHVDLCLPAVDFVLALDNGQITQACRAKDAKVSTLMALASPKESPQDLPPTSPKLTRMRSPAQEAVNTLNEYDQLAKLNDMDRNKPHDMHLSDAEASETSTNYRLTRALYQDEHQEIGHVGTSSYWMMITAAGGYGYWIVFAGLYIGAKVSSVVLTWILEWWTADPAPDRLDHYLVLYISANVVTSILGATRWVWLYGIGNVGWYSAGTKKIHRKLFATIANAPLEFFETTPAGRILNVFAQDVKRIDSSSADDFGRMVMEFLRLTFAAAVVGWEAPAMLLILVAFGIPLLMVANGLGQLRANLRRLAAVADSPLISLYNDSIDGVVMLRAFGLPNVMAQSMKALINRSRSAETWNWIVYNWVRSVVLTFSSVFVTATAVVLIGRDITPSKAGFILAFASQISGNLFSLLEHFITMEQTFVSAERINHYIEVTPQESHKGIEPPPEWPSKGAVVVRDLSMRYADDLPDVLHNVSFSIEPGHRVGLVGATGSGKSTLALSLFRAMDPRRGKIIIDGLDTSEVSLQALRSRLNMVVQDGSLPSGTLRNALDVSGESDDADIYDALKRVHLLPEHVTEQDVATNPFANLDTFVATEGSNFSHGQRQLLCLARALLKKSRILVMDEATSSVDFEMDTKITTTIRECFTDTTMLVIAHRLATIVAYDRVLVLDRGQIIEYDKPVTLMQREGSAFRSLCMAQGQDEFERLLAMAS